MRPIIPLLVLLAPVAHGQIYHCDGPQGPVYSDQPCGEQATVITVEDASSGISLGPSEATREYLASKREERAHEREQRQNTPNRNQPQEPVVVSDGGNYGYPVFWPGYGNRPNRPNRPRPERPIAPPPPEVDGPGSVLRPRGGRN